jgi:hypothetical protein
MKKALALASVVEAATGIFLLVSPSLVVRLLLGAEIDGVAALVSRVAGISLIGLALACWPNDSGSQPLYGMLTYSALVMLALFAAGVRGEAVGLLLWPAVVAHAILVTLLLRAAIQGRERQASAFRKAS